MTTPKPRQIDKFRDAAREAGTDDSEEAFDRVLKRVAHSKKKPTTGKTEEADDDKTK